MLLDIIITITVISDNLRNIKVYLTIRQQVCKTLVLQRFKDFNLFENNLIKHDSYDRKLVFFCYIKDKTVHRINTLRHDIQCKKHSSLLTAAWYFFIRSIISGIKNDTKIKSICRISCILEDIPYRCSFLCVFQYQKHAGSEIILFIAWREQFFESSFVCRCYL